MDDKEIIEDIESQDLDMELYIAFYMKGTMRTYLRGRRLLRKLLGEEKDRHPGAPGTYKYITDRGRQNRLVIVLYDEWIRLKEGLKI